MSISDRFRTTSEAIHDWTFEIVNIFALAWLLKAILVNGFEITDEVLAFGSRTLEPTGRIMEQEF